MLELCARALDDEDKPDPIVKAGIGLIGDLADIYPNGQIKQLLLAPWIATTLKDKHRGASPETKRTVKWAREVCVCSMIHVMQH